MATLVVSLLGRAGDDAILSAAADLGRRFGAEVMAVHGSGDPSDVLAIVGPGTTATMSETLIAATAQQIEERRERAHAVFENLRANAGEVALTWMAEDGRQGDLMARHAIAADLAVTARPDDDVERAEVLEALLFRGGGPVLSVPPESRAVSAAHIAVAWDGGASAGRALRSARPLLRRADTVTVVTVREGRKKPDSGPVLHGLKRLGVAAQAVDLDGGGEPVGAVLFAAAADNNCDLLVMGAYGHSRMRELILGGATRDVVRTCPLPAWLSH